MIDGVDGNGASRRPDDSAAADSTSQAGGALVGLVDGSLPATTRRFHVTLADDAVVQLDDLVVTPQRLPDDRVVSHYGIVTENSGYIEGASYATDTARIAHELTMPGVTARRVEVQILRTSPELWLAPDPGAPVYRAAGTDRDTALFLDQMVAPLAVGLDQSNEPVHVDFAFVDGTKGGHVNISGISGVATKTTYALFLLYQLLETPAGRALLAAHAVNTRALGSAELQSLLVDAATDARDCERDVARARRHGPVAAELDDRLQHADAFLDALGCLQAKLADGAFIRNLISRRQRALLGVASTMLSEMTNERYGFADDFQIVDRVSGLARGAKTLSGGESFLASLALALAMVEIAGRAGGRLDALFLDEGFGALDTNNLDAALDALESRARAGRLIVVISHVLAVAERVPDVLAVRSGTTGATEVSWLSEADRAGAIDGEISDALSGLLA